MAVHLFWFYHLVSTQSTFPQWMGSAFWCALLLLCVAPSCTKCCCCWLWAPDMGIGASCLFRHCQNSVATHLWYDSTVIVTSFE